MDSFKMKTLKIKSDFIFDLGTFLFCPVTECIHFPITEAWRSLFSDSKLDWSCFPNQKYVIQFGVLCIFSKHCLYWNKYIPLQMKFWIIFGEKLTLKNEENQRIFPPSTHSPPPLFLLEQSGKQCKQYNSLFGGSISDLNFYSFAVIYLNLTGSAFWKLALIRDICAVLHDQGCLTGVKNIWKWAMMVTWVAGQQWGPEVSDWFSRP